MRKEEIDRSIAHRTSHVSFVAQARFNKYHVTCDRRDVITGRVGTADGGRISSTRNHASGIIILLEVYHLLVFFRVHRVSAPLTFDITKQTENAS